MDKFLKNSTYGIPKNLKLFIFKNTIQEKIIRKLKMEMKHEKDLENLTTINNKKSAGTKLTFAERNILNIASKRKRKDAEYKKLDADELRAYEAYTARILSKGGILLSMAPRD